LNPLQNPTGKERSQRIEMDYYRKPTDLDRWRRWCVAIAVVLGGTYAVYLIWFLPTGQSTTEVTKTSNIATNRLANHFSTGDLALPHASFEQDCEKCHADFTPLDANAPSKWFPLIGVDADVSREHLENKCQECHRVGNHFRESMTARFAAVDQNCSHCHQAHQGRDFQLTQISQRKCATCHDDLSPVTNVAANIRESVTAFNEAEHGNFVSLQSGDRGKIRFSHAQHLMPGQVGVDVRGGMTLDRLSDADRQRYRTGDQRDGELVQLQCNDCHTIVGQNVVDQLGVDLKSVDLELLGRSMNPIQFEEHCVACHAISPGIVSPPSNGNAGDRNGIEPFSGEQIRLPHAVTSQALTGLIAASIDGARTTGNSRHRRDDSKKKLPPGVGEPLSPPGDWRVTDEEIAVAKKLVLNQCKKCHDDESVKDAAIVRAQTSPSSDMIPRRWLRRGLYDHAAHRLIDCRYCHADAYLNDPNLKQSELVSEDQEKVMIAGIESCQDCHRPAGSSKPSTLENTLVGGMPNWASDECITCHRYHAPMRPAESDPVLDQREDLAKRGTQ
jgi:hypothetical protein